MLDQAKMFNIIEQGGQGPLLTDCSKSFLSVSYRIQLPNALIDCHEIYWEETLYKGWTTFYFTMAYECTISKMVTAYFTF